MHKTLTGSFGAFSVRSKIIRPLTAAVTVHMRTKSKNLQAH